MNYLPSELENLCIEVSMENRSRAPKRRTIEVAVVPHQGQHHMNEDDKRRKVTISSIINLVPNPKELLDVRVFMPNRTHIDFQMQRGQIFGIRIRSLVERIQMEVREQEDKFSRPKQRSICWGSHLTIEDFEGNIIDDKNSTHLIKESRRSVLLMLQVFFLLTRSGWLYSIPSQYTVVSVMNDNLCCEHSFATCDMAHYYSLLEIVMETGRPSRFQTCVSGKFYIDRFYFNEKSAYRF